MYYPECPGLCVRFDRMARCFISFQFIEWFPPSFTFPYLIYLHNRKRVAHDRVPGNVPFCEISVMHVLTRVYI